MIYVHSLGRAARYYGGQAALSIGRNRLTFSSLEVMAYCGPPMPVEVYQRTRRMLPGVKLVQVYGTTETGFLTGLEAKEDTIGQLNSENADPEPQCRVQEVRRSSNRDRG